MKMKKLQIALLFLLTGLTSCYEDYIEDYETTSAGFAISNPLRTVISDRNMSIYVGVSLGGKREVDKADWAKFTIDESLLNGTGFTLLPSNYYTLGDPETFRVRKSTLPVADVEIKFTDAFYADERTHEVHYALPFRVIESSMDQIREGGETSVVAIKYASSFSGTYYLTGNVVELDEAGNPIESTRQSYGDKQDIIKSPTCVLTTLSKSELIRPGIGDPATDKKDNLRLTFENNGNFGGNYKVQIGTEKGFRPIETITGNYIHKSEEYTFNGNGDVPCPEIALKYIYEMDEKHYQVDEKLVLRRDPIDDLRIETW